MFKHSPDSAMSSYLTFQLKCFCDFLPINPDLLVEYILGIFHHPPLFFRLCHV